MLKKSVHWKPCSHLLGDIILQANNTTPICYDSHILPTSDPVFCVCHVSHQSGIVHPPCHVHVATLSVIDAKTIPTIMLFV